MSDFIYHAHSIYYEETGEGRPLMLLHGNTASSNMFGSIAPILAKTHRVILIDFLGCGRSERIPEFSSDLWYDEAMQVIAFLEEKQYGRVDIIGTSGGALAALNVALERPDLVRRLIADSFEGESADSAVTDAIRTGREMSKQDAGARAFYEMMNGADWEQVVDADTSAVVAHAKQIVNFFHHPLSDLQCKVLLTGSARDSMFPTGHFRKMFDRMLLKIPNAQQHIFSQGDHPAMLSNAGEFLALCEEFLAG